MDPFMAHTDPLPQVLAPWKEEGDYFAVHIDVGSCEREGIKLEMKDRRIKITFERTGIVNRTVFDNIRRRQEKVDGVSGTIMLPDSARAKTMEATLENYRLTITCKKRTTAGDGDWRPLEIKHIISA